MDKEDVINFISSLDRNTKRLDLSNKDISEIPPQIGALKALEYLNLSYNNIKRLPEEITTLSQLRTLLLLRNKLEHLPDKMRRLEKLEVLDLSYNKILDLPEGLENFINLRFLDAGYNQIKKLPLEFTKLQSLKELHLEENPFEFPPYKVIQRGLYATMYFLNEEARRMNAAKVNLQVYNLPENLQTAFVEYIECFKDIVSDNNETSVNFDTHFVNMDAEIQLEVNSETESYLYDFIHFMKENIYTLKTARAKRPRLNIFESQVRELKNQIIRFNGSLSQKMEEMSDVQKRLDSLSKMLED